MSPLLELARFGQSYWLDDLTRPMIESGELQRRVTNEGLTGVTANPSIFRAAPRFLNGDGSIELNKRLSSGTRTSMTLREGGRVSPANGGCDVIAILAQLIARLASETLRQESRSGAAVSAASVCASDRRHECQARQSETAEATRRAFQPVDPR
jgi:hypothetical protein